MDELISTICHSGELGELANSGEDETPWKHSKPAELGRTDFPDSVELTLADGIYIKKEGMSNAALNRIKRLAAFRKIGQLGAGKNTLNGIVDIATMQSLTDGDAVKELVRDYGMVICDECHHVSAVSFEKVLSAVVAKNVYGLTATPIRADGHQPIIFMQCGSIRYRVDAKEQAKKSDFGHFILPRFIPTCIPNATELTIQEVCSKLTDDDMRNRFIVKDVISALNEGRSPLVLTERREHAVLLAKLLGTACVNVFLLSGSDGQKIKREKLEALKAIPPDQPLIVVATGKYIGEGFDEPRLDTLFLTMPIAWRGTLAQYAGRLHRDFAGKCEVRIYDYVDVRVKVLERMYHKRLRGYAELGYQSKAGDSVEQPSVICDSTSRSIKRCLMR